VEHGNQGDDGGIAVILGLNLKFLKRHKARFVETGMHGGVVYIHGEVRSVSKEAEVAELNEEDWKTLYRLGHEFCKCFKFDAEKILEQSFKKSFRSRIGLTVGYMLISPSFFSA